MKIPSTTKETTALQQGIQAKIDSTSRALYLQSGDPQFKEGADQAQGKMIGQIKGDTDSIMEEATLADGVEDPNNPERLAVRDTLVSAKDAIIGEFDNITRLQATDPVACHKQALAFQAKMANLNRGIGGDYNIDFSVTGKFPELQTAFLQITTKFENIAGSVAIDALQNNPGIIQYNQDANLYVQRSDGLMRSVTRLQNQLARGVEMPSEDFVNVIKEGARQVLNSPLRIKLQNNKMVKELAALKFEDTTGKTFSKLNIVLDGIKTNVRVVDKKVGEIKTVAQAALKMEGQNLNTVLVDVGVISACVAGAAIATVATGGLAAAAGGAVAGSLTAGGLAAGATATGFAAFAGGATTLAVGSVVAGAGATVLGQTTKAVLLKDASHVSVSEMGKAMAWNTAFSFGLGGGGMVLRAGAAKLGSTALAKGAAETLKGATQGTQGLKGLATRAYQGARSAVDDVAKGVGDANPYAKATLKSGAKALKTTLTVGTKAAKSSTAKGFAGNVAQADIQETVEEAPTPGTAVASVEKADAGEALG